MSGNRRALLAVSALTLAIVNLLAVAWITPVGAAPTTRTVKVKMVDIAFEPTTIEAAVGERITFVFTNRGEAVHDAFIGNAKAQAKHEREMRKAEDSEHGGHGDETRNAVTVKPGKRAKLTHTFKKPGTLEIGCHQPDHYTAGMRVVVTVA